MVLARPVEHGEFVAGQGVEPPGDHARRGVHLVDPLQGPVVGPKEERLIGEEMLERLKKVDHGEQLALVGRVILLAG